jgi:hypothetical protein
MPARPGRHAPVPAPWRWPRDVGLTGHDGAVLGALLAQDAGQLAGVDAGDGDDVAFLQVVRQRLLAAEVRQQARQVLDDQAGGVDLRGFDVFTVDARVADVRIGQGDDLAAVAGVGQDFLVAGHRGVEHHLTGGVACGADGKTLEDRPVCEREDGGIAGPEEEAARATPEIVTAAAG